MMNTTQPVQLRAAAASHRGRVRASNQDACLLLPERGLFILADGMGGHQAGEIAAQTVVALLPKLVGERAKGVSPLHPRIAGLILEEGIATLSEQIRLSGAGRPGMQGMGATVALVSTLPIWRTSAIVVSTYGEKACCSN